MLSINCKGRLLNLSTPVVMGIINITPDSFYAASREKPEEALLKKVGTMLQEGAAIIDVGGQSTRPGSKQVGEEEELHRVLPAIEMIVQHYPEVILSIDTFYASVARAAVKAGAALVNDVSGGTIDAELIPAVAASGVPYVLMHMQGHPQTMQQAPNYKNVVIDVFDFLHFKIHALHQAGIKDVIVDPGFGFGKTIEHNFTLLNELAYFKQLGKPLMAGLSRKGTVYKTLGTTAEEALNGTTVLNTVALLKGANILRVHDVKAAMEAITLTTALQKEKEQ